MELILLQKVTNLGNLGDKVTVKPGYGRNFLVPQGKAEQRKASLGEEASVTIYANASTEGKLYGSVGPREIAEALTKRGTEVGKSEVVMGEGAIRQVGEYNVMLHLHADVEVPVKVIVEAEPA